MEIKKVKEIIMFDIYQNNSTKHKSFKIFINDDNRNRTIIYDTIITVLKLVEAVSIKRIIDNKIFFIYLSKDEDNIVQISKSIAMSLYEQINSNKYEIWNMYQ